jgi:hypothetical protein
MARRQQSTTFVDGAQFVARHPVCANFNSNCLFAASADAHALRYWAAGAANANTGTRNKSKLFVRQFNRRWCITLLGVLRDLYRFHILHLSKKLRINLSEVAVCRLCGGGGQAFFLPACAQPPLTPTQ